VNTTLRGEMTSVKYRINYEEPVCPNYILRVIKAYIKDRNERYGKNSNCFTYDGLHNWYSYSDKGKLVRVEVKWHTIERCIRRLCEEKILNRIYVSKKKVIFCLNE